MIQTIINIQICVIEIKCTSAINNFLLAKRNG